MRHAALIAALVLAGCARTPSPATPFFRLAAPAGAGVEAEAADPAPDPSLKTATLDVAAGGQGVLRIELAPRAYALQATAADVAKVVLTLNGQQGADTPVAPNVVATLDKAALDAGTQAYTFTGLAAGWYMVKVQAYDAAGQLLGERLKLGIYVKDATPVPVPIALTLRPTVVALVTPTPAPTPVPTPTPTATPVPTPVPTPGSIEATLDLLDGLILTHLPTAWSEGIMEPRGIGRNETSSHRWTIQYHAPYATTYLAYHLIDGQSPRYIQVPDGVAGNPVVEQSGNAWVRSGKALKRYSPELKLLNTIALTYTPIDMALDNTGILWVVTGDYKLRRYASTGSFVNEYYESSWGQITGIVEDGDRGVWISCISTGTVRRLSVSGSTIASYDFPKDARGFTTFGPRRLVRAPFGAGVWVMGNPSSLDPMHFVDGTGVRRWSYQPLGTIADVDFSLDPNAGAWVLEGRSEDAIDPGSVRTTIRTEHLTKLDGTGAVQGRYHIADDADLTHVDIDPGRRKMFVLDATNKQIRRIDVLP